MTRMSNWIQDLGVSEEERREREKEDRRLAQERKTIARDGPDLKGAKLQARLEKTWAKPPGIVGWLSSVDHKDIGRRYIVTALIFLALFGEPAVLFFELSPFLLRHLSVSR